MSQARPLMSRRAARVDQRPPESVAAPETVIQALPVVHSLPVRNLCAVVLSSLDGLPGQPRMDIAPNLPQSQPSSSQLSAPSLLPCTSPPNTPGTSPRPRPAPSKPTSPPRSTPPSLSPPAHPRRRRCLLRPRQSHPLRLRRRRRARNRHLLARSGVSGPARLPLRPRPALVPGDSPPSSSPSPSLKNPLTSSSATARASPTPAGSASPATSASGSTSPPSAPPKASSAAPTPSPAPTEATVPPHSQGRPHRHRPPNPNHVKPLFVSPGHLCDLPGAVPSSSKHHRPPPSPHPHPPRPRHRQRPPPRNLLARRRRTPLSIASTPRRRTTILPGPRRPQFSIRLRPRCHSLWLRQNVPTSLAFTQTRTFRPSHTTPDQRCPISNLHHAQPILSGRRRNWVPCSRPA